ncbi:single-stranded DNA-binding protein [Dysgonomonas capnocytophagoides]|uniref:single-stranded DNA-binding protein n=1 Tax=Dysgonomonas capnocytophagoides TaxID=45254 RepID=UPI002A8288FD|nr:single-stranded DNA-binding protein [Dysgonomonas capnocytophagoides]
MIEIQAIGYLGKDAEQKTIGDYSYASFSLAITEKIKGEDKTTWIRVMKMDKEGKLTSYLTKGTKVWVRGNPSFSAYISKNTGEAISDATIWADKLEFCSSGEKQSQKTESKSGIDNFPLQTNDDNDLPF